MKCLAVWIAVWIAAVGLCLPEAAMAATQPAKNKSKKKPVVTDVALRDHGVLIGQVVDPQGVPLVNVPVSLRSGDRQLAAARGDKQGNFAFRGLRGGVYQVEAARGGGTYRLWAKGTAPPTAEQSVLVVAGKQTVRGQYGRRLMGWLQNPCIMAGVVAAAVAIPVAIHNNTRSPASP